MKRTLKIIGLIAGILLLLLVGLVATLPLLIDPNDYKPRIVQLVKDNTGRELRIDGQIGLSFFPWLGLEFNQVSLGNAPGFGPEPFARIDRAGLKVKLLPLLRREVQVDRVILAGLDLQLARDRAGRTNWQDMLERGAAKTAEPETPPERGPAIASLEVAGLDVRDTRLEWRDAITGSRYTLQDVALSTGVLRSATTTPVRLDFDFESGSPPLRSHVSLRTEAALDLANQTLQVSDLVLELAGLKLTGEVKGNKIVDAPAFAGRVEVSPFNLRELLARLGVTIPTQDPKALSSAALSAGFQATTAGLTLPELTASLDQSKLSGNFAMPSFAPAAYRFDLRLDQFDLDRYLAPAAPKGAAAKDAPAATPAASDPFAPLRGLDAEGRFRVGQFKAFGLKTSDTLIALKAKDDNIAISPIQTKLYSGGLEGSATLDLRGDTPAVTVEQKLAGVQLEPLLRDAEVFEKFAGAANIDARLSMRGRDTEQWLKTLSGNAGVEIRSGQLMGVDLGRMANEIEAAVRERKIEGVGNLVPRAADRTPFEALRMTANVKDGVVQSDDLAIEAAGLRVAGKGTANLPAQSLDYVLFLNQVPLKVTGPFASLRFKPDWNAIAKSRVEKEVEKQKEKLKGREDELREDLQKKLDERLKGLFKK